MLKVLQVLGSLQRGGAETFVMNVYRRIDRTQIQFDFLVKERVDNGYEAEALAMGARIFTVPSPKSLGPMKYISEQRRVIAENGPYIAVHSHVNYLSGMTLLAAKLAGVSNRIAHSHSTRFPQGFGERISKTAITPLATKLFACSDDAGRALFEKARFEVVGNGVDWEKYALVGKAKPRNPVFTIVQIGRFVEVKNHQFTVRLLERLKRTAPCNFSMVFLGDGPLLDEIKDRTESAGLSDCVAFPGSVADPEIWLGGAECVLMPSLYEGIPLSAIESQCAGCELLVSDQVSQAIDLGLGICHFLPLELDIWEEEIERHMLEEPTRFELETIQEAVVLKGYDPEKAAFRLSEYYGSLDSSEQ